MSDALLQRVGVSADKFIYIMNPEEQDWLLLQEKVIQAVDEGDRESALPLLEEYNKMTLKKCKLHRQFVYLCEVVMEWKNGMHTQEMLDELVQAWKVTMGGISMEDMMGYSLSLMECIIRMMFCRIQEDRGCEEQSARGYAQLLAYFSVNMDEEDRVKLYPQIASRLLDYYLRKQDYAKAVALADETVDLLKVRGRLFYMRKFLTVLFRYGDKTREERVIFREACEALEWLYDTWQVNEEEWVWNIPFGMAEVELCGDLIRARRKAMGMSQEKLAEGICDAVTISRIERGKVAPKTQVLQKIMERIGMKEGGFEAINQIEQPEFFDLANRISILLSLSNGEEAEPLIEELERRTKKSKKTDKFVKQYIEYVKALALAAQRKISAQEHYERQSKTLHLTMPFLDRKRQSEWRFSRQEVNIANILSYSCEEIGRTEEVLELLYDIKNQYEHKPFPLLHYITGYELTIRNLGNLLGNLGRYEEAIEIAKQGILMGLKAGRGTVLSMLLYDCGWDMEQLWPKAIYTKQESLYYIKASAILNLLLYGKEQSMFFVKHLINSYQYEIEINMQ